MNYLENVFKMKKTTNPLHMCDRTTSLDLFSPDGYGLSPKASSEERTESFSGHRAATEAEGSAGPARQRLRPGVCGPSRRRAGPLATEGRAAGATRRALRGAAASPPREPGLLGEPRWGRAAAGQGREPGGSSSSARGGGAAAAGAAVATDARRWQRRPTPVHMDSRRGLG